LWRSPGRVSATSSRRAASSANRETAAGPGERLEPWRRSSRWTSSHPRTDLGCPAEAFSGQPVTRGERGGAAAGSLLPLESWVGRCRCWEVEFVDPRFGFVAAGPRRIFRTRDGGQTWQPLRFGCPRFDYLGGLAFANRRVGFAACGGQPATAMQQRLYAFTAYGGTTWRRGRETISSGHVALVASPSPRTRYVYASRHGIFRLGGPILLVTDDIDSVLSMSWPTPRVGYALLLHDGLMRTTDDGRHWRRQE
jgi:hypothetical protein